MEDKKKKVYMAIGAGRLLDIIVILDGEKYMKVWLKMHQKK